MFKDSDKIQKEEVKKDLVITRLFDAPRYVVWEAWTSPLHLMHWWGPKEFTVPACDIRFHPGGKYLVCMRSPEGEDYWSTGVYKEIDRFEKFVCTDSFADEAGNVVPASHYGFEGEFPEELYVTVSFEDFGRKTKMTLRHSGFPEGELRDMCGEGWNESFDKLVQWLKINGYSNSTITTG